MKNLLNLEILKTNKTLSTKELMAFRLKFIPFLDIDGIASLCLEAEYLYIEFNQKKFNIDSFKRILTDTGFPLELEYKLVS
jgi:hypothetical protein